MMLPTSLSGGQAAHKRSRLAATSCRRHSACVLPANAVLLPLRCHADKEAKAARKGKTLEQIEEEEGGPVKESQVNLFVERQIASNQRCKHAVSNCCCRCCCFPAAAAAPPQSNAGAVAADHHCCCCPLTPLADSAHACLPLPASQVGMAQTRRAAKRKGAQADDTDLVDG